MRKQQVLDVIIETAICGMFMFPFVFASLAHSLSVWAYVGNAIVIFFILLMIVGVAAGMQDDPREETA